MRRPLLSRRREIIVNEMTRVVLFDHDGVLIDSEILKAESWLITLGEFSVSGGDVWYKARIGRTGIGIAREAVRVFGFPINPEDLTRKRESLYEMLVEQRRAVPVPGVVDLVKRIAASKIRLAVVSSERERVICKQLAAIDIESYFEEIVSGEDAPNGKENSYIYLLAAERLNVSSADCLAIEDSSQGIASAKGAGMYCVGYRNPLSGGQNLSLADIVVEDFSTLDIRTILSF